MAATDQNDQLASFSNYGATSVDLAAPGVNILSTVPKTGYLGNPSGYAYLSGTSMATPHVVGVAALIRDLHPGWTYTQVKNSILAGVDPLPSLSGKTVSGGRLNAAASLAPDGPALSINNTGVTEGNSDTVDAVFTVTLLNAPTGQTVTVDYATADRTATAPSDYQATSGTLTFAPGTTTQSIRVHINGDTASEPDETFAVNLSNPHNAALGDPKGIGTIRTDDPPTLTINDRSGVESDHSTVYLDFIVSLSYASSQTVTVAYTTADGTATARDYLASSGTLTFSPGQTTALITVGIRPDNRQEPTEYFYVKLSNATNAVLGDDTGVCTIFDDDTGKNGPTSLAAVSSTASSPVPTLLQAAAVVDSLFTRTSALGPRAWDDAEAVAILTMAGQDGTELLGIAPALPWAHRPRPG